MKRKRVDLHIDEIALKGAFSAHNGTKANDLSSAIEQELGRLLRHRNVRQPEGSSSNHAAGAIAREALQRIKP